MKLDEDKEKINEEDKEENEKNKKQETNEKELLKPMYDVVFQCLFSQKNINITKNMISALIEEEVKSIKINDTKELFREYPEDKLGILDLEAEVNNNEVIDVEIQLINRNNLPERLLMYFSKLYSMQVKIGKDYEKAKRVVIVAITNFDIDLTKQIKEMETIWNLRERNHPNLVLTNKIEIHIINIMKAESEYIHNSKNKKAQWMMFIKDPNCEEVRSVVKENKEIEEAVVEVKKLSQDEKLRKLAELRLKAIMDEKDIYRAGKNEEKIEIAKKMIKMELPIEQIEKVTDLTKEEIEKLM